MNHPLTDKIIEQIAQFEPDLTDSLRLNRTNDMRAVADWQLEQCIDWLEDTDCDDPQETAQRLRKAMRPQQEDN